MTPSPPMTPAAARTGHSDIFPKPVSFRALESARAPAAAASPQLIHARRAARLWRARCGPAARIPPHVGPFPAAPLSLTAPAGLLLTSTVARAAQEAANLLFSKWCGRRLQQHSPGSVPAGRQGRASRAAADGKHSRGSAGESRGMRLAPPDSAFFDAASSPNTLSLEQALVLHTRRGAALPAGPARTSAALRPVVDSLSTALMIHQTRSWEGASSAPAAPAPLLRPLPMRLPLAPRVFAPATARAGTTHCPLTVPPQLRGPIAFAVCLRPEKARRHAPIDIPTCVNPCQCPASPWGEHATCSSPAAPPAPVARD